MAENEMFKSGADLVVPHTAKDSADSGITGLTVKFSIQDLATLLYWDNTSAAFDSVAEVLNTATEYAYGLYMYVLTGGVTAGSNAFSVRVQATDSVAGDIANFRVINTDVGALAEIKAKTDNLPHSMKKATAIPGFKFVMLDATTKLPLPGLTITAVRKLDADASWAAMTGTIVDNGSGAYSIDINVADNNGDTGIWKFTATGAETTFITILTEAL